MADRVVLHIGTMKSGTTYLQAVLTSGVLEQAGAFYPGGRFGVQTRAVRQLVRPEGERRPEAWRALAAEVRQRTGVAVVSQEFLSFARRERAQQVVGSFGGTPVDVVLTVRDQRTVIAAQWQSHLRHRGTDDLATYVARLRLPGPRDRLPRAARSFRRAQDVPGHLRRWADHDGVSSITVVVVPPPGSPPTELWRRFSWAAGLETGVPPAATLLANESLGYASCDVLRRANLHLGGLGRPRYRRAREQLLEALLPLRHQEGVPALDRETLVLAGERNRTIAGAVEAHGAGLVGSLEELPVTVPVGAPDTVAPPDEAEVRRALETAWRQLFPGRDAPDVALDQASARLGRRLARQARGRRRPGRREQSPGAGYRAAHEG